MLNLLDPHLVVNLRKSQIFSQFPLNSLIPASLNRNPTHQHQKTFQFQIRSIFLSQKIISTPTQINMKKIIFHWN